MTWKVKKYLLYLTLLQSQNYWLFTKNSNMYYYYCNSSLQNTFAVPDPRLSVYDCSPMIAVGGLAQDPRLHVQTFVRVIEKTGYLLCCLRWELQSPENRQVAPKDGVLIKFVWNHSNPGILSDASQYLLFHFKLSGIGFCCLWPEKLKWQSHLEEILL